MKIKLRWLDHGGHCTLQALTDDGWQDVPVEHVAEVTNHAELPDERGSAVTAPGL